MAEGKQKIGWIGIGRMGYPMAERLLDAGHDVAIWNRTRAKAEPLAKLGGRIVDRPDAGMAPHDIAAHAREGRQVGETHRGGLQRQSDREVGVILHDDAPRLALFIGAPKAVSGPSGDVPHPRRNHLRHRAGRDHLVERHVGNGTDQRQVTALLADDLVHRGERDAGLQGKPERDRVAIVHLLGDRLAQRAPLVAQRWLQRGGRFSMKARIPSSASCDGATVVR